MILSIELALCSYFYFCNNNIILLCLLHIPERQLVINRAIAAALALMRCLRVFFWRRMYRYYGVCYFRSR